MKLGRRREKEHFLFVPAFSKLWRLCGFWRLGLREKLHITYLLTRYGIYGVVRRLKYRKYACASSALYLQHPVSRYRRIYTDLLRSYHIVTI